MEKYLQNDLTDTFLPELLLVCAEIHFISQQIGVGMRKGFQIIADGVDVEQFGRGLRENGCVEFYELKSRETECFNYELGFRVHAKSDRTNEFLFQKKFLPAIIVNFMPHEELRELTIPLLVKESDQLKLCDSKFQDKMNEIRKFIRSNPEVVVRELQIVKSQRRFDQSDLETAFRASAAVCLEFFRNTHSVDDVIMERRKMETQIRSYVQESLELYEEVDMLNVIRNTCDQYLSMDANYIIGKIEYVDKVTEKAIKDGDAIIYDEDFYYICNPLFRKACGKLLETVSFIKIKWELKKGEVLVCNRTSENSFTIKKSYLNDRGEECRERFLKLKKHFFVSKDGLSLEERKGKVDAKKENTFKYCLRS